MVSGGTAGRSQGRLCEKGKKVSLAPWWEVELECPEQGGRHQCLPDGSPKEVAGICVGGKGSLENNLESDPEGPRLLETQTPGLGAWDSQTSDASGLPQTQATQHTGFWDPGPFGMKIQGARSQASYCEDPDPVSTGQTLSTDGLVLKLSTSLTSSPATGQPQKVPYSDRAGLAAGAGGINHGP